MCWTLLLAAAALAKLLRFLLISFLDSEGLDPDMKAVFVDREQILQGLDDSIVRN